MNRITFGPLALCLSLLAAAAPAGALEWASVTEDRLLNADKDPSNWLIYGRTYNSNRYSPLSQVNASNVKKLVPAYSYSLGSLEGQQVTPSVNNGIMIVAVSQQYVDALDAKTGARLWRYEIKLPADIVQYACCGLVTKGVGLFEDKVYVAALDARLIALDAKTGKDITHSILTQIIMEEEASGGEQMLPVGFLRQLISMYGDSMQSMMPQYLEASMANFRANQAKLQDAWKSSVGPEAFAKLAETNMAMFKAAASAFIPKTESGQDEVKPAGELDELKAQMAAMQKKLDELGK